MAVYGIGCRDIAWGEAEAAPAGKGRGLGAGDAQRRFRATSAMKVALDDMSCPFDWAFAKKLRRGRLAAFAIASCVAACSSGPSPGHSPGPSSAPAFGGAGLPTSLCVGTSCPVAAFPLDATPNDAVSGGVDGTVSGPTPTVDRFGTQNGALHFEAAALDRVTFATNAALPVGRSPRTLSLWFRSPPSSGNTAYQTIITWGAFDSDQRFGVSTYGVASMFTAQYDDLRDSAVVCDGIWHHAAASFDGTTTRYFVDGAMRMSRAYPNLDTVGQLLAMGVKLDPGQEYFQGDLDDVRIFDQALSDAAIATLAGAR